MGKQSGTIVLSNHHACCGCLANCMGRLGAGRVATCYCANPGCVALPGKRRYFHIACIEEMQGKKEAEQAQGPDGEWMCQGCV